jgi:hypothetical protein
MTPRECNRPTALVRVGFFRLIAHFANMLSRKGGKTDMVVERLVIVADQSDIPFCKYRHKKTRRTKVVVIGHVDQYVLD